MRDTLKHKIIEVCNSKIEHKGVMLDYPFMLSSQIKMMTLSY